MPKILINEIDRTTAGTPGEYSNNSVLICGFAQRSTEEIINQMKINPNKGYTLPDDNGIFEFSSVGDFETTIGLVAPSFIAEDEEWALHVPPHYGNQMAYELLKQGYPTVIYMSLGKIPESAADAIKAMKDVTKEDAWEIFKDKASYDFRFITHGFLSAHNTPKAAQLETEMNKAIAEAEKAAETLKTAQATLETAEKNKITTNAELKNLEDSLAVNLEEIDTCPEKGQEGYEEGKLEKLKETKKKLEDLIKTADAADKKAADDVTKATSAVQNAEVANETAQKAAKIAEEHFDFETEDCFTTADFNNANAIIAKLAAYKQSEEYEADPESGRGDCVALVEINEDTYISGAGRPEHRIEEAAAKLGITAETGKYCTCTVPSVVYKMDAPRFGDNTKFPGAFHYLACYKRMIDMNFAEWYAAAGYNRGVSSYTIDHTTVKLGEIAIQALEPRYKRAGRYNMPFAVNVVANFRGSYYLWGNRTCHLLGDYDGGGDLTAHHFLNIRQLCTTIKKQLYVSCRRFTFDPNSDVLWINFKNSITPTLDRMKADQGVRDYKVEKVYTDKKATLKARVRIVPIEAIEDFVLEVSLEDSLGETAVTVTE